MKSFQLILEESMVALLDGSSTVDECLVRYPQYAVQLESLLRVGRYLKLGREVKPSQAFKVHSRVFLAQHLRFNPRYSKRMQLSWRVALTLAMLFSTLFVTGTVHAQSVLPGDSFYQWKRASEELWRAFSINRIEIDIALSQRRLNEWVAVADDPALRLDAMRGYFDELRRLKQMDNLENHKFITPIIQAHQKILTDAGLPGSELVGDYLNLQTTPVPVATLPLILATNTMVFIPTYTFTLQPTFTLIPPTLTNEPLPTATATEMPSATPTEVPTFTATPTDVPAATPTEPAPTATVTVPEPTGTAIIIPLATDLPPPPANNP